MIPLPPDEVHVWTASREAPDAAVEGFRALLTDDERRRADRFASAGRPPAIRRRPGPAPDRSSATTSIARAAKGSGSSPTPTASPASTPPPASTRRSGSTWPTPARWSLYAIARGRDLGVDIERIRPEFGAQAIASRFFAPGEVAALLGLPVEGRTLGFFHGWTRKEAYIKARGMGLALPLDEFEVALDPARPAALLATAPDPGEAARWSLVGLPTEPGYVAAVCVEGSGWKLRRGVWATGDAPPSLEHASRP